MDARPPLRAAPPAGRGRRRSRPLASRRRALPGVGDLTCGRQAASPNGLASRRRGSGVTSRRWTPRGRGPRSQGRALPGGRRPSVRAPGSRDAAGHRAGPSVACRCRRSVPSRGASSDGGGGHTEGRGSPTPCRDPIVGPGHTMVGLDAMVLEHPWTSQPGELHSMAMRWAAVGPRPRWVTLGTPTPLVITSLTMDSPSGSRVVRVEIGPMPATSHSSSPATLPRTRASRSTRKMAR